MTGTACDSSPYGEVYVALKAIEPCARAVPPGTQAAIGRTLDFLRASADSTALKRLETISLLVETLWHCARTGDQSVRLAAYAELDRLSDEWLAAAPMGGGLTVQ